MKKFLLLCVALAATTLTWAQNQPITESNYELPARFTPDKMSQMIYSTSVSPKFLKSGKEFWYTYKTAEGTSWYIVDMAKRTNTPLFDNAQMAAQITQIVKDPCEAKHLPLQNITFSPAGDKFIFEVVSSQDMTQEQQEAWEEYRQKTEGEKEKGKEDEKGKGKAKKHIFYLEYDRASGKVSELEGYQKPYRNPRWASVSPDGKTIIFSRNFDLYWMDEENFAKAIKNEKDSTIIEHQITHDGSRDFAWGGAGYSFASDDKEEEASFRKGAQVVWSPDSKHFIIERTDKSELKELWVINNTAKPRPVLETYKYEMPGEENDSESYIYLFDTATKEYKEVNVSAFKNQRIEVYCEKRLLCDMSDINPATLPWMGASNDVFFMQRTSRDHHRIDICKVDITAAEPRAEAIVEERMNTSIETRAFEVVNSGNNIITWSQRTGWAHLYLYDLDGNLVNPITSGEIHCEKILNIDHVAKKIYFVGYGVNQGEDPNYAHLCSVGFDGSGLKCLTQVDFDHNITMSDDAKYFVDNYSRVDTTPVTELKSNLGTVVAQLQTADLSSLFASGYKFPERFTVKAADGITDLYGVMYKPFDFDPNKLYPIIEYVYPGPQTEAVNSSFSTSFYRLERLAQFGFIVISVGNRGGYPNRSLWYHNYGYGNLRDYGLDDKVVAVNQLANRHNFIDRTKVGITGHSGGGFMSTAAILKFPDFFKVAVSCAGNHENNIYNSWWSEKHHGVKEVEDEDGKITFDYAIDQNSSIAKDLKGKLLLVHGDIDDNVHPAGTMTVAQALIKAGKRFDMMILPGQRHGFGDMTEYYFWLMGDYFSEHLIGDSEKTTDIPQLSGYTK